MGSGMHFPFRSWALSDQNDRLTLRGDFRDVIVFFFFWFSTLLNRNISLSSVEILQKWHSSVNQVSQLISLPFLSSDSLWKHRILLLRGHFFNYSLPTECLSSHVLLQKLEEFLFRSTYSCTTVTTKDCFARRYVKVGRHPLQLVQFLFKVSLMVGKSFKKTDIKQSILWTAACVCVCVNTLKIVGFSDGGGQHEYDELIRNAGCEGRGDGLECLRELDFDSFLCVSFLLSSISLTRTK